MPDDLCVLSIYPLENFVILHSLHHPVCYVVKQLVRRLELPDNILKILNCDHY